MILNAGVIQSLDVNLVNASECWLWSTEPVWSVDYAQELVQPLSVEVNAISELRFLAADTTITIRRGPTTDSQFVWSGVCYTVADPEGGTGTGTVSSVGLNMPSLFSVIDSPVTTSGTIGVVWAGSSLDFVLGDGTTVTRSTYLTSADAATLYQPLENQRLSTGNNVQFTNITGTGIITFNTLTSAGNALVGAGPGGALYKAVPGVDYLTSVGLTAPSLFTVTGSPRTTNGNLAFAWNGSSTNLVRADGSTIAQSTFVTGGPYLLLSGGTMTGNTTVPTPNSILNPTSYAYIPSTSSPLSQGTTNYSSHDWSAYTAPTQEKTANGTTWVADTLATKLFDAYPSGTSVQIVNMATPLFGTRWTWNNVTWSYITKVLITYAYTGAIPSGFTQTVEVSADGVSWTNVGTSSAYDTTAPTIFSIPTVGSNPWLRVTIMSTSGTGYVNANSVQLWTNRLGDQGKGKWNYLPFTWDYNKKLIANTVNADQAYIGKWANDATYARMGHVSYNTSTGFGYLQTSDGRVFTASGTSATVRIGSIDLLTTTAAGNTLNGTTTLGTLNGILKATLGIVSVASSSDLPGGPYLPLAGGVMVGPITGTTTTATPLIHITSTFGNLTNAAIRATASASGGCALHGIATGASGVGVWGTSSNTGGDAGLFSGQGGSNALRAIASGGGKAGLFVGDVQVSGSLLSNGNGFGVGSSAITISSSSPVITFNCTSAPLDAKQWHLNTDINGDLIIQTRKDDASGGIVLLQATRVGDAISSLSLGTTTTWTYIKALTSYGFVKTNSSGLLSVDTNSYLPTGGGVVTGSTTFSAGIDTLSLYVSGSTSLVGGINGVTDGSSAASGKVGEILTASNSGTTFSGTTAGVSLNSISLPAGSWLVWAGCSVTNGASPLSLRVFLSYSSTGTTYIDANASYSLGSPASGGVTCNHAPIVINRSTTATVYLIGSEITTGTAAVCTGSTIYALRLR